MPWMYVITGGVWAQLQALLSQGSAASGPLSACWQRGASAAAHRTPSTPHPHGITAKEQPHVSFSWLSQKEQRLQADLHPAATQLTLVSHEVSLSFLALASALCRSSSACLAAVAASMSLIFRL